jgi:hypothetical protein
MDVKIRAKPNKESLLGTGQPGKRQREETQSEPWKERLCTSLDATSGSGLHIL